MPNARPQMEATLEWKRLVMPHDAAPYIDKATAAPHLKATKRSHSPADATAHADEVI
jgi:hypothetical protein